MVDEAAFPANPFWDWSVEAYERPGAAPAFLALQDRAGLDVNVALFCCWAGERGIGLRPSDLDRIDDRIDDWVGSVVLPLRDVRRRLKAGFEGVPQALSEAVRQDVLAVELDAERVSQSLLASLADTAGRQGTSPAAPETAALNLAVYARWARVDPPLASQLLPRTMRALWPMSFTPAVHAALLKALRTKH